MAQVYESHAVSFTDAKLLVFMVRFKVTTESQPEVFFTVWVALLLLDVYVLPSIHEYESQAVWTSVPVFDLLRVRFSVTTESQPVALVSV